MKIVTLTMKIFCVIFIFFASTSALTLNCEFREVRWLAFGLNYQCHSEAFDVNSTQYVTGVTGVHLENKSFQDVISIHIDNCTNLSYIPKGLLSVFPMLRGIYLEGCGITSLRGCELNEYPHLKLFALELSPLDAVPENLFAQTPDMVLISFADNKIERTGEHLLDNLNDLSQVYFENNVCTNKNAPTPEEIPDLITALHTECLRANTTETDCSGASEKFNSVLAMLLSSVVIFGKYILNN